MSEIKPAYAAGVGAPNAVTCSRCGAALGEMVDVGGLHYLRSGGVLCRALHGACRTCGEEFHWVCSDRMLSELIERVLRMRTEDKKSPAG